MVPFLLSPQHYSSSGNTIPLVSLSFDRLAQEIFGVGSQSLRNWPGFQSYVLFLQSEIQEYGGKYVHIALQALHKNQRTLNTSDELEFVADLAAFMKIRSTGQTIDDILQSWITKHNSEVDLCKMEPELMEACRQAAFYVLCWTSLLIRPSSSTRRQCFDVVFPPEVIAMPSSQSMDNSAILTSALIRGFCHMELIPGLEDNYRSEEHPNADLIYVSSMNYYMLHELGRVTIEWTTLLSCHLMFIESTRTLYLFCLPTTLALCCLGNGSGCAFDGLLKDYYEPTERTHEVWQRYRQEVLLSYRLLFGQTKMSRKLFKKLKKQMIREGKLTLDPFLEVLCSCSTSDTKIANLPKEIWPKSCRDLEGRLAKFECYGIDSDFPLIGRNLLAIQRFCLHQRPRTFWSFWIDTRDRPKWFTFWLVTIVGIAALILAIVEVGLSAAQIAVSAKS